ncbi:YciI family protein [Raineyella sp.]|uniref:YCII-related domain-containing protein n=1 Tax=bioreactor metagenome TaxID=1076179 RepID=A0A645H9V3_9ZZZZ|nr:YciI family protein [Raineyella sp.]MEA5155948.1 YciI family protein [Raineyella sp.]
MPQYLLSVHHADAEASDAPPEQVLADVAAFNDSLLAEDRMAFAGGLLPASQARVVDATGARVTMHRGTYLPGTEQLGGFWVVRADDLVQALEIAERASAACRLAVEVRPFQEEG